MFLTFFLVFDDLINNGGVEKQDATDFCSVMTGNFFIGLH